MSQVARGIAALRGGRPVAIGGERPLTVLALETATDAMLGIVDPQARAPLLISGRRAAALALSNRRDAAAPDQPVLLARPAWLDRAAALALADPQQDYARAPQGPLEPIALEQPQEARAALALARAAGLLPAMWLVDEAEPAARLSVADASAPPPAMTLVAEAALPIPDLPPTHILAFRAEDSGEQHVALRIGAFAGRPPLVRLHSECLTGDVFGSLKCDCGAQLRGALALIGAEGGGVLLYLRQEGRGIGLANKLRAYALQDRGLDTVDANQRLGFEDDERDYLHAAAMLRAMGIDRVRLLTNNPAKVAGLEAAGVAVVERIAHHMPANPHNADYLAAKRRRSGHLA